MYSKTTWYNGDLITALKLNNMEDGIETANAGLVLNETEFADAINNPQYKSYYLGSFTITSPISIADREVARNLTFIGGEITLNSAAFTYPTLTASSAPAATIPNFNGTTFARGTADTILATGFYMCWTSFVECRFINVSLANGSRLIQSPKFTNCYWIADSSTPDFIGANAVFDAKFTGCSWEANYKPLLINVVKDETWGAASWNGRVDNVAFVNCISEGRDAPLIRRPWMGATSFFGIYTESNTAPLMVIYEDSTVSNVPAHSTTLVGCRLQGDDTTPTNPIVALAHSGINSLMSGCEFTCIGCTIANGILVNSNYFKFYTVQGCRVMTNAQIYPHNVLSRVEYKDTSNDSYSGGCWTNGTAAFANEGTVIRIRKSKVALLTFVTSSGAKIVFAGHRGSTAFAHCLNDSNFTMASSYDSDTRITTITLSEAMKTYDLTAVDLEGISLSPTTSGFYDPTRSGFAASDYGGMYSTYTE